MHYYQFNIGDYRKDTQHLTPLEHYIYRYLIDWYYLDELPIPKKTQVVMRRLSLGLESSELLSNVMNDFFVLREDGYHHDRIDFDINTYHAQAKKNRENGKKGGRPKKQQLKNNNKPKITQPVILANPSESETNPNQELITNNQEPRTIIKKKEFDLFYSIYPKKTSKKLANKYWQTMNEDDKQLAIDGINSHCYGKEIRFMKNPSSYLREELWNDEIIKQEQTLYEQLEESNNKSYQEIEQLGREIDQLEREEAGASIQEIMDDTDHTLPAAEV